MDRTEALSNNHNPQFKDTLHVPWNGRLEQMFQFEGWLVFFCFFFGSYCLARMWYNKIVWDINGTIPADKFSLALTQSKHNYIGSFVVSAAELLGDVKEVS